MQRDTVDENEVSDITTIKDKRKVEIIVIIVNLLNKERKGMFLQQNMKQQILQSPQGLPTQDLKINNQAPDTKEIQFQTESSVYSHYRKVNSKEDQYKQKILHLQKAANSLIFKYQAKVDDERMRVKRMRQKKIEIEKEQIRTLALWNKSVQEISSHAVLLVLRIKEIHQRQILRIQKYYNLCIEQLQEKLGEERRKREEVLQRMNKLQTSTAEEKQQVKLFMAQFLRSGNRIKQIQVSLKKKLESIIQAVNQKREVQRKQLKQITLYLSQIRAFLFKHIQKQKVHRQIHKEKILEYFQNLFVSID